MISTPAPVATYRLQLHRGFDFEAASALVPYLADLGISHLYLSPITQATPGSAHGYDQCDPTRVSEDLGGDAAFRRLAATARSHGLGIVLDIVPNHMATSQDNPWWWEVLRSGQSGRAGIYFDIDWETPEPGLRGRVMVPVLGEPLEAALEHGRLALGPDRGEPSVRYFDQRFPLSSSPGSRPLAEVLDEQHYALTFWRQAAAALNYRRFFNINSLVALRQEDAAVFVMVHDLPLALVERGDVQGLRVDHVDGLRDPAGYLRNLRRLAPQAWLLVEKILAPRERLPADWPVDGTTGYDFIHRLQGVFIDARAEPELTALYRAFSGDEEGYEAVVARSKREVAERLFAPDVARLERILERLCSMAGVVSTREQRVRAITAVAVALPVYRTYVPATARPGPRDRKLLLGALAAAQQGGEDGVLKVVERALLNAHPDDPAREFTLRFQQLSGPLMAKGVEDTGFYRYNRMICLNEVGCSPGTFGTPPREFHAANAEAAQRNPRAMLASSTHDTKRGEDVRARLSLLSMMPGEWADAVGRWSRLNDRHRQAGLPDRSAEYLLYQTLVGAWPLGKERAVKFMIKAAREASTFTSWTDPDRAYEDALEQFVAGVLEDPDFQAELDALSARLVRPGRQVSMAQVLLKLTAPGVPDIYQGTELFDLSLVDPDNRRPVDYRLRRRLLASGEASMDGPGSAKIHLIRVTLGARRAHPAAFAPGSKYTPLRALGPAAGHVLAFARGTSEDPLLVVVAVARLVMNRGLDFSTTALELAPGTWSPRLRPGSAVRGPRVPLTEVFGEELLGLLVREP